MFNQLTQQLATSNPFSFPTEQNFELYIKCFTDSNFTPFTCSHTWILRKYTCSYDILVKSAIFNLCSKDIKLTSVKLFETNCAEGTEGTNSTQNSPRGNNSSNTTTNVSNPDGDYCDNGVKITNPLEVKEQESAVVFSVGIMRTSGHSKKEFYMTFTLNVAGFEVHLKTPPFKVKTKPKRVALSGENVIFLSPLNEQKRGRKRKSQDMNSKGSDSVPSNVSNPADANNSCANNGGGNSSFFNSPMYNGSGKIGFDAIGKLLASFGANNTSNFSANVFNSYNESNQGAPHMFPLGNLESLVNENIRPQQQHQQQSNPVSSDLQSKLSMLQQISEEGLDLYSKGNLDLSNLRINSHCNSECSSTVSDSYSDPSNNTSLDLDNTLDFLNFGDVYQGDQFNPMMMNHNANNSTMHGGLQHHAHANLMLAGLNIPKQDSHGKEFGGGEDDSDYSNIVCKLIQEMHVVQQMNVNATGTNGNNPQGFPCFISPSFTD